MTESTLRSVLAAVVLTATIPISSGAAVAAELMAESVGVVWDAETRWLTPGSGTPTSAVALGSEEDGGFVAYVADDGALVLRGVDEDGRANGAIEKIGDEIAPALAGAMPLGGVVATGEETISAALVVRAADGAVQLVPIGPSGVASGEVIELAGPSGVSINALDVAFVEGRYVVAWVEADGSEATVRCVDATSAEIVSDGICAASIPASAGESLRDVAVVSTGSCGGTGGLVAVSGQGSGGTGGGVDVRTFDLSDDTVGGVVRVSSFGIVPGVLRGTCTAGDRFVLLWRDVELQNMTAAGFSSSVRDSTDTQTCDVSETNPVAPSSFSVWRGSSGRTTVVWAEKETSVSSNAELKARDVTVLGGCFGSSTTLDSLAGDLLPFNGFGRRPIASTGGFTIVGMMDLGSGRNGEVFALNAIAADVADSPLRLLSGVATRATDIGFAPTPTGVLVAAVAPSDTYPYDSSVHVFRFDESGAGETTVLRAASAGASSYFRAGVATFGERAAVWALIPDPGEGAVAYELALGGARDAAPVLQERFRIGDGTFVFPGQPASTDGDGRFADAFMPVPELVGESTRVIRGLTPTSSWMLPGMPGATPTSGIHSTAFGDGFIVGLATGLGGGTASFIWSYAPGETVEVRSAPVRASDPAVAVGASDRWVGTAWTGDEGTILLGIERPTESLDLVGMPPVEVASAGADLAHLGLAIDGDRIRVLAQYSDRVEVSVVDAFSGSVIGAPLVVAAGEGRGLTGLRTVGDATDIAGASSYVTLDRDADGVGFAELTTIRPDVSTLSIVAPGTVETFETFTVQAEREDGIPADATFRWTVDGEVLEDVVEDSTVLSFGDAGTHTVTVEATEAGRTEEATTEIVAITPRAGLVGVDVVPAPPTAGDPALLSIEFRLRSATTPRVTWRVEGTDGVARRAASPVSGRDNHWQSRLFRVFDSVGFAVIVATVDLDGEEVATFRFPLAVADAEIDTSTDTDGDGIPDDVERSFGMDPFDPTDADADPDGDGVSSADEVERGTSPFVSNAPLAPSVNRPARGSVVTESPLVLSVNLAPDPDGDPLLYEFELYRDRRLTDLVINWLDVEPGELVATVTAETELEDDRAYFWRARACEESGVTCGTWLDVATFTLNLENAPPSAPQPLRPSGRVGTSTPDFAWRNADDPEDGATTYDLVVRRAGSAEPIAEITGIAENLGGVTSTRITEALPVAVDLEWTVTATDEGGETAAAASPTAFRVSDDNTAPSEARIVSPADGTKQQETTIAVLVENATDPDGDTVTIDVQLADNPELDGAITTSADQDPSGFTELELDVAESGVYHIGVSANDGAASGPTSQVSVEVRVDNAPPVAPTLISPVEETVETLRPTLRAEGASDPEGDELVYDFEIFADPGLRNRVESGSLVEPQSSGDVQWQPLRNLANDLVFYWRARSVDEWGATSPWSDAVSFLVSAQNAPPSAPTPSFPAANATLPEGATVTLVVENATDPDGELLRYTFEVFADAGEDELGQPIESRTNVAESGSGRTAYTLQNTLAPGTYRWRAQASDGRTAGPFTDTQTFTIESTRSQRAPGEIDDYDDLGGGGGGGGCTLSAAPRPGASLAWVLLIGVIASARLRRRGQ